MKPLTKSRTVNNFYLLVILFVALVAFKYSARALAVLFNVQEVADLGVDILQPIFVSIIYVCCAVVFSTVTAGFIEPQLREDSFGTWSRYAIIWLSCFWGFLVVSSAIL